MVEKLRASQHRTKWRSLRGNCLDALLSTNAARYAVSRRRVLESDWCADRTHLMCTWSTEHSCSELCLQPASSPWHPATCMVLNGVCAVMVMFFDVWICLFSQKSIASISLWFLYIERVGLKLPNYKSHKLAWNSLLCVMKSFCWVVFMKTLRFVWQSRAVVSRFHDVLIHAFPKKVLGCLSFSFSHQQI